VIQTRNVERRHGRIRTTEEGDVVVVGDDAGAFVGGVTVIMSI